MPPGSSTRASSSSARRRSPGAPKWSSVDGDTTRSNSLSPNGSARTSAITVSRSGLRAAARASTAAEVSMPTSASDRRAIESPNPAATASSNRSVLSARL